MKMCLGVVLIVALSFVGVGLAADATPAPLGSTAHQATPAEPIGWRGDWTGRFPGATPPTIWSRRVAGPTSALVYQAKKPSGEPGQQSEPLAYFTIKDWLVAGPFSVDDPAKDIDKDLLGGEANVEPDPGAKAGANVWQPLRVNIETQSRHEHNEGTCGQSYVDFLYTFGKISMEGVTVKIDGDFTNQVAYAHTYIYSPAAARVQLQVPFDGAAGRFWLNGQPTDLDPKNQGKPYDAALKKGWNRLLLKISTNDGRGKDYTNRWFSKWLVAAYITPLAPVSYETKNVVWMTKMTGRSMSQPIIVGDKIFVGSGISDLMCIDKKSGKVVWLQSSTPYDGLSAEQRSSAEIKESIEPKLSKLDALNKEVVAAINAAVSPQGLPSHQEAELDNKLKAKAEAERAVHIAFQSLDRKQYPAMFLNEVSSSNSTPCSDGQFVYWVCGGGMKGPGGYVISCFDLDGKRIWSRHDAFGAEEHGNHSSPALVNGKLIFAVKQTLYAFDAKTGKEVWKNSPNDWQNSVCGESPIVTKIGKESVIISKRYIHRASDGSVLCPSNTDQTMSEGTPIVDRGLLYNPCRFRGWQESMSFIEVKLPATTGAGAKAETVWAPEGKDVSMPLRGPIFSIASPLYVDGVVYAVEMGGGLTAVDTNAKRALYRQWLDGYNRYNRFVYGVCASPTLAGKQIYITDDAGYTHIIEPGPQLKESARNVLENLHFSGMGGNPCHQESFYTSPYFEGKCMYLRGEDYLYCISDEHTLATK